MDSPTPAIADRVTSSCASDSASRDAGDFQILIEEAIELIEDLGTEFRRHYDRLLTLRRRLEEGRFHLAALGQFKRGKSTLINAFLGQPLLPTSVVPLTAVPTFLKYGPDLRIRVRYEDGKPAKEFSSGSEEEAAGILQGLVTEEGNPENRLRVEHVEVLHPASILRRGVVLIDTPGIGSTFTHNTRAALDFLPQCDAAFFVISADPPLTEVEADFLKAVRSRVARLFFIFNKVDYLNAQERDAALAFFRKTLDERIGPGEEFPIFCVSARRGLDAKLLHDPELLAESGLREVEDHLVRFLASEKTNALREALGRKTCDVIEEALMQVTLSIKSLRMPLEDLERRLDLFAGQLKNAERERTTAQDILASDRKRTLELLEQEAEALRKRSAAHLEQVVEASFDAMKEDDISEQDILDGLAEEVTSFFRTSAEEVSRRFGSHVTEALRPHQNRADNLIGLVRKAAAELFEISYHAPESSEAFETKRRPYWVLRKRVPSLPIVAPEEALDRLLPAKIRIARLRKRLSRQIDTLTRHNVENLRWATLQNLNDAFRRFALVLDQRLEETIAATHGAVHAAYVKRKEHAEAIAEDLSRFEAAAADLKRIRSALGYWDGDPPIPRDPRPES